MSNYVETLERPTVSVVNELIGSIYMSVAAPERWPIALDGISELLDADVALIVAYDFGSASCRILQSTQLAPHQRDYYRANIGDGNAWIDRESNAFMPEDLLAREPNAPSNQNLGGGRHPASPTFRRREHSMTRVYLFNCNEKNAVYLVIDRRPPADPLGSTELDLLRNIVPHLRLAWRAHEDAAYRNMVWEAALEVLDRLRIGVTLVDESQRVVASNNEAKAIFALNDGLSIRQERLSMPSEAQCSRLRKFISIGAISAMCADNTDTLVIPRLSEKLPFRMVVGNHLTTPGDVGGHVRSLSAIFIVNPDKEIKVDPKELRAIYRLTSAEARVASLLIKGKTLREAADELNVSYNTVRTHMSRVLEKTGTDSQARFLRVVLSGAACLQLSDSGAAARPGPGHDVSLDLSRFR